MGCLSRKKIYSLSLADVPTTFVQAQIPDHLPHNLLLPDFLEQLQPHRILAGASHEITAHPSFRWLCTRHICLPHVGRYSFPLGSAMQCSAVQCSAVQCSAVQCSAVQLHSHLVAANRLTAQCVLVGKTNVHQFWCGSSNTDCCLHQLAAPCHSVGVVQDVQAQTSPSTCELTAAKVCLCIGMRSL